MKEENIKSNKGRGEDVSFRKKSRLARAQVTWKSWVALNQELGILLDFLP